MVRGGVHDPRVYAVNVLAMMQGKTHERLMLDTYDIVYVPRETPLLKAAAARGNRTVGGLGMLLHQARPCWKLWFGIDPEVTPALRAAIEATF